MRVNRASWAVLVAAMGCAGASHTMVGPGTFSIECKRSQSNCWEHAYELCPNGFDELASDGSSGTYLATNTYTGQVTAVPTYSGAMLVRCRTAQAASP